MKPGHKTKRFDLKGFVRKARIATLASAICGALYLGFRFDLVTLPAAGCSPVSKFAPGVTLLVDRWADDWGDGNSVFVEDGSGSGHLGSIRSHDSPDRWVVTSDSEDCPTRYPAEENPIHANLILGRVLMGFGGEG